MNATAINIENEKVTKTCICCGRTLPIEKFKVTRIGRLNTCNECVTENQKKAKAEKKLNSQLKEELDNARQLRLDDFTPRELMVALKKRGYEFTAKKVEIHIIDSKTL